MNKNIKLFKKLENSTDSIVNTLEYINISDKHFIQELFNYAEKNWMNKERINDLIKFAYKYSYLKDLLYNEEYFEFIFNNVNSIVELKNMTKNYHNLTEKIIEKSKINEKIITDQLIEISANEFNKYFYKHLIEINNNKLNILKEVFYMIIAEISQNENTEIANLEYIDKGAFSNVYCLGNKIIKIGIKRITPTFPNNPYIIKPLLRRKFEIGYNAYIFIEICEKIKTNCCNEEDMYEMYKNLRNLGLIWNDPKVSNIGKLIKDNKIHWNKNLKPSDKALMLNKYRGNIELKANDIILCDADAILDENNPGICMNRIENFEKRYQKEKNK